MALRGRIAVVGLLFAWLALGPVHSEDSAGWHAPLEPPLRLTGTFAEPRSAHLHAGGDLSTGGKVGQPVRAVDGGSVVRLRAGAFGYGKALYFQTDQGLLAVYGHLHRFAPRLDTYLRERQWEQGEYEIDLYPSPGRFRFERGDTLGLAGATGSGPPHLHFELRDGDTPVNPQLRGLVLPDHRAPQIGRIRLRALAPEAYVADGAALEFRARDTEPIPVWGPVGVDAEIRDRCGLTDARLSPLHVRLYLDGELLYQRSNTELDFSRGRDLKRIYGRAFGRSTAWVLRMYRWPLGAVPDVTEQDGLRGIIRPMALAPGVHTLCLEAEDAAGHVSEVTWEIVARPPTGIAPRAWRAALDGEGEWLLGMWLERQSPEAQLPLSVRWRAPHEADWTGRAQWMEIANTTFAAHVPLGQRILAEVIDRDGRPLLPPLLLGGPRSLADVTCNWRVRVEESGVHVEVVPEPPLPGVPRVETLSAGAPYARRWQSRGRTSSGGWGFALSATGVRGVAGAIRLIVPECADTLTLETPRLIGVPAADTLRIAEAAITASADCFPTPAVLTQRWYSPGDSLWHAMIGEDFMVRAPQGDVLRLASRKGGRGDLAVAADRGGERLRVLSRVLDLGPDWWPLMAPLGVSLDPAPWAAGVPESRAKWGLYRRNKGGLWHWLGNEATPSGISATTNRLGHFALLEDTTAPRILAPSPPDGETAGLSPRLLRVRLEEHGSGFDPRRADIFLNGEALLAYWDVDDAVLTADLDRQLPAGRHVWEVRVVDRAGNERRATFQFTIAGR